MDFLSADENITLASQEVLDKPKGLAKFRTIKGKKGSGRFVVSEGVSPSGQYAPISKEEELNKLYESIKDMYSFEIVIPPTVGNYNGWFTIRTEHEL